MLTLKHIKGKTIHSTVLILSLSSNEDVTVDHQRNPCFSSMTEQGCPTPADRVRLKELGKQLLFITKKMVSGKLLLLLIHIFPNVESGHIKALYSGAKTWKACTYYLENGLNSMQEIPQYLLLQPPSFFL